VAFFGPVDADEEVEGVGSRVLCKKEERFAGPLSVESFKDGVEHALGGVGVLEAAHGSWSSSDLSETALDHVRGSELAVQRRRLAEEAEELIPVVVGGAFTGLRVCRL
jgi:GNAT superfamily N-acetyltransferase